MDKQKLSHTLHKKTMSFHKQIFIALLLFLFSFSVAISQDVKEVLEGYNYQESASYYGPVEFAKKIINETELVWSPVGKMGVNINYVLGKSPLALDAAGYLLWESPKLGILYMSGNLKGMANKVSSDFADRIIHEAIRTPKVICKKIMRATIFDGFNDYEIAYKIARSYLETGKLSLYDALTFLDRRWGLFKLPAAANLYNSNYNYTFDESTAETVINQTTEVIGYYVQGSPIINISNFIKKFYDIQSNYNIGLPSYEPYVQFNKNMDIINQLRLYEAERWQPAINIIEPNSKTKWDLNNRNIKIKWASRHLEKEDLVSFYLIKNDVRITKFGPFKNTGELSNIISLLNRNKIDGGEGYYLYAYIELNPAFAG